MAHVMVVISIGRVHVQVVKVLGVQKELLAMTTWVKYIYLYNIYHFSPHTYVLKHSGSFDNFCAIITELNL